MNFPTYQDISEQDRIEYFSTIEQNGTEAERGIK